MFEVLRRKFADGCIYCNAKMRPDVNIRWWYLGGLFCFLSSSFKHFSRGNHRAGRNHLWCAVKHVFEVLRGYDWREENPR